MVPILGDLSPSFCSAARDVDRNTSVNFWILLISRMAKPTDYPLTVPHLQQSHRHYYMMALDGGEVIDATVSFVGFSFIR